MNTKDYSGEIFPVGCGCSYVVQEEDRDKFHSRSKPGVVLGYVGPDHLKILDDWYDKLSQKYPTCGRLAGYVGLYGTKAQDSSMWEWRDTDQQDHPRAARLP